MSDLWDNATRDIEAERRSRSLAEARAANTEVWHFLASATSEYDFETRLALVQERIDAPEDTREAMVEGWRKDAALARTKTAEAEDQKCSICGKQATNYAYQEGTRASGLYVCDEHVGQVSEGRTVEKVGSRKIANGMKGVCSECGNPVTWMYDASGQRGEAWHEDDWPGDQGFQCRLSEDGLHHSEGGDKYASRKQAAGDPGGIGGGWGSPNDPAGPKQANCAVCGMSLAGTRFMIWDGDKNHPAYCSDTCAAQGGEPGYTARKQGSGFLPESQYRDTWNETIHGSQWDWFSGTSDPWDPSNNGSITGTIEKRDDTYYWSAFDSRIPPEQSQRIGGGKALSLSEAQEQFRRAIFVPHGGKQGARKVADLLQPWLDGTRAAYIVSESEEIPAVLMAAGSSYETEGETTLPPGRYKCIRLDSSNLYVEHEGREYAVPSTWLLNRPEALEVSGGPEDIEPYNKYHEASRKTAVWYTITSEYNGAPDGPKFIVRRFGDEYIQGFDTQAEAETWIEGNGGRVGKPDPVTSSRKMASDVPLDPDTDEGYFASLMRIASDPIADDSGQGVSALPADPGDPPDSDAAFDDFGWASSGEGTQEKLPEKKSALQCYVHRDRPAVGSYVHKTGYGDQGVWWPMCEECKHSPETDLSFGEMGDPVTASLRTATDIQTPIIGFDGDAYSRPGDPPVVAIIYDPETGQEYDRAWSWETGQNYARSNYNVVAVAPDGGVSIEEAQSIYDTERRWAQDCWGLSDRQTIEATRKVAYPKGRSDYKPGQSRMGEPTPQSDPDLFSSEDILAEIKYLMKLNKQYGSHELRTMAYLKLERILKERGDLTGDGTGKVWRTDATASIGPRRRQAALLRQAANWNDSTDSVTSPDSGRNLKPGMPGVCPNCHSMNVIMTGAPLAGPGNPYGHKQPQRSDCKDCGARWITYPTEGPNAQPEGTYTVLGRKQASDWTNPPYGNFGEGGPADYGPEERMTDPVDALTAADFPHVHPEVYTRSDPDDYRSGTIHYDKYDCSMQFCTYAYQTDEAKARDRQRAQEDPLTRKASKVAGQFDHLLGKGLVGFPGSEIIDVKVDYTRDVMDQGEAYHAGDMGYLTVRTEDGRELTMVKDFRKVHTFDRTGSRRPFARTAGQGPNGFWCRVCGEYQSIRNPAERRAMDAHMQAHKDAGEAPEGGWTKGELDEYRENRQARRAQANDPFGSGNPFSGGNEMSSTPDFSDPSVDAPDQNSVEIAGPAMTTKPRGAEAPTTARRIR